MFDQVPGATDVRQILHMWFEVRREDADARFGFTKRRSRNCVAVVVLVVVVAISVKQPSRYAWHYFEKSSLQNFGWLQNPGLPDSTTRGGEGGRGGQAPQWGRRGRRRNLPQGRHHTWAKIERGRNVQNFLYLHIMLTAHTVSFATTLQASGSRKRCRNFFGLFLFS